MWESVDTWDNIWMFYHPGDRLRYWQIHECSHHTILYMYPIATNPYPWLIHSTRLICESADQLYPYMTRLNYFIHLNITLLKVSELLGLRLIYRFRTISIKHEIPSGGDAVCLTRKLPRLGLRANGRLFEDSGKTFNVDTITVQIINMRYPRPGHMYWNIDKVSKARKTWPTLWEVEGK